MIEAYSMYIQYIHAVRFDHYDIKGLLLCFLDLYGIE